MCRCTVAWQVKSWRVFLSFYLLLSIKHAFELPDFGTVVASEVKWKCRDSVTFHKLKLTAWITRFVNIVIGDTSDGGTVLSREHRK